MAAKLLARCAAKLGVVGPPHPAQPAPHRVVDRADGVSSDLRHERRTTAGLALTNGGDVIPLKEGRNVLL
eukprot:4496918-Prymnesium_polylepis.1